MSSTRKSIHVIIWLIGSIIAILAAIPAITYFFIGYNRIDGTLGAEIRIQSESVTRVINMNPTLWEFEEDRIRELVSHTHRGKEAELVRVFDREGNSILETGSGQLPPRITHRANLYDFGMAAGSIETSRSLRPLLVQSAWILLAMSIGGVIVFRLIQVVVSRTFLRTEKRLRAVERRYWSLFNDALDMIHIVDTNGNIVDANRTELEILGYTKKELLGRPLMDIVHHSQHKRSIAALGDLMKGEKIKSYQTTFITKAGKEIDVEVNAVPQIRDGEVVAFRSIIRDITERERSQAKLLGYQKQLHALASVLSSAEERERRELAAVLHDDIGQLLAVCKLNLEKVTSPNGGEGVRNAPSARNLLERAISRTRSLTWELSSQTLYDLGLKPALEELCTTLEERHNLRCMVVSGSPSFPIPETILGTVYRATRELLYNVLRHAEAKEAIVTLSKVENNLLVTVSDDGNGFEESAFELSPGSGGRFGLFNIRERMSYIGGRLDIDRRLVQGSRVQLTVPLVGRGEA